MNQLQDRDAGERADQVQKQMPSPGQRPSAPLHPIARPALHGHVFRRHARPA
jgi:hypothetical protein